MLFKLKHLKRLVFSHPSDEESCKISLKGTTSLDWNSIFLILRHSPEIATSGWLSKFDGRKVPSGVPIRSLWQRVTINHESVVEWHQIKDFWISSVVQSSAKMQAMAGEKTHQLNPGTSNVACLQR